MSRSCTLRSSFHFATLCNHLGRLFSVLCAVGVIWPILAIACLLMACYFAWVTVPLMPSLQGWVLPVDLGWGVRSRFLSYGLLSAFIACVLLGRSLIAFDWVGYWFKCSARWRPHPLCSQSLMWMGWLSISPSLLFLFQFVLVDFRLVSALAAQENQSLLIRNHLGYHLANQHIALRSFQFGTATLGDRLVLLIDLADFGSILPLIGGLLCFYGAFVARRKRQIALRAHLYVRSRKPQAWRAAFWLVVSVLGIILLGRAPLGLLFEHLGIQAVNAGDYQSALAYLARAEALNPAFAALPGFHQERGEALYQLHSRADLDAGLYLAAQYRAIGALNQAWLVDTALYQQYPHNASLQQDMELTLEMLAERFASARLTPVDEVQARRNPQLPLQLNNQAMIWLDKLLQLEPNHLYAHYLRGRILFATHNYELAARDFQLLLRLSSERNMQSTSYTYLAFCRGGVGDYAGERSLLQIAVELDDGYYNTTAREAASGLH